MTILRAFLSALATLSDLELAVLVLRAVVDAGVEDGVVVVTRRRTLGNAPDGRAEAELVGRAWPTSSALTGKAGATALEAEVLETGMARGTVDLGGTRAAFVAEASLHVVETAVHLSSGLLEMLREFLATPRHALPDLCFATVEEIVRPPSPELDTRLWCLNLGPGRMGSHD
jgi:hypothetical protein